MAIAKYIPCLRPILRVTRKDSRSFSSYPSSRRSTVTSHCSQSSDICGHPRLKGPMPSVSDSESTSMDADDISLVEIGPSDRSSPLVTGRSLNGFGQRKGDPISRVTASRIPSIVVTYSNYQGNQAAVEHNSTLPCHRTNGPKHNTIATIITETIPENSTETSTNQSSPKKS